MISKIIINKAVMFNDETPDIDNLQKINYFFGENGTGKTTISNIIGDPSSHPGCNVTWEDGRELEIRVYNRNFVEQNFRTQADLKGVFTLGEDEGNTLDQIKAVNAEIAEIDKDIASFTKTLNGSEGKMGKIQELADLEKRYEERFFTLKHKYDSQFEDAFRGYRNNKKNFKDKLLEEAISNQFELKSYEELKTLAQTIFANSLSEKKEINNIQIEKLLELEKNAILKKRVIGKNDVDIAAMITKLGNSDWVRQGRSFYETNDRICPFCQQCTQDTFAQSLTEYFDDAFDKDTQEISLLLVNFIAESNKIQQAVKSVIDLQSEFIDTDKLVSAKQTLDLTISLNIQKLEEKKKEPSQIVELNTLQDTLITIKNLISEANFKIAERNKLFNNIENEKKKIVGEIWKFIIHEIKDDICNYNTSKNNLLKAIKKINTELETKETEKEAKNKVLRELENKNISIQPTLNSINGFLATFGFTSFKLKKGLDNRTYCLVRKDGSDACSTLSEGEKSFVTFLYFYYLIGGSQSETGLTKDKVVVFDDPVSSLDSTILFIVSSMIRKLIKDVCDNKGLVKQIFVLTHNVYFYKEVTYCSQRRGGKKLKTESFWIVRKHGLGSTINKHDSNPITTAYQLLWNDVRSEQRNNTTIQNTLRRILESYFKLLGDISLDQICTKFNGDDMLKCRDLCSWLNDGSHSGGILNDEYYSPPDDVTVSRYLEVFKAIFDHLGQTAHYNMMMGIEQGEESDNG